MSASVLDARTTGRPTKRTDHRRAQILAAIAAGNPFRFACAAAGISEDVFARWRAADSSFAEELKTAEGQFVASNLARITDAALKNWQASAWLLERRYPTEFARRFEVTGEHGAPFALTVYLPENGRGQVIDSALPKAIESGALHNARSGSIASPQQDVSIEEMSTAECVRGLT